MLMSYPNEDVFRAIGILLIMAVLAMVFIPHQQLLDALIHGLIVGALIALIIVVVFFIEKYMEGESGW
jgi:energy-coupling factor transporter transmembrane protein EcfT